MYKSHIRQKQADVGHAPIESGLLAEKLEAALELQAVLGFFALLRMTQLR